MRPAILVALFVFMAGGNLFAQASTNPAAYTTINESTRSGRTIPLNSTFGEIDNQSLIEIHFDESKMALPLKEGEDEVRQIEIRVEAFQTRNGVQTPIVPIDNYVSGQAGAAPARTTAKVAVAYVFNDKPYDGDRYRLVPDAILNLSALGADDAGQIEIRVTNLATQETLVRILTPRAFGFRIFRAGIADSLLFVKRLGVSAEDEKDGAAAVHFSPAPGLTYGGTYLARGGRGGAFVRFLQPGVGINVSFMNWNDPAFDAAIGKFATGTKGSDVDIGLGVQFSLFNSALQFSYGANLQARQDRTYFGLGVSFVNLGARITGLFPK
jgi:hypothetical protein